MDPLSYWLHVHSKRLGISRQIVSCSEDSEDSEGESGNSSNDGGTENGHTGCALIADLSPFPSLIGFCCGPTWSFSHLFVGERLALSLVVGCRSRSQVKAENIVKTCLSSRFYISGNFAQFVVYTCGTSSSLGANPTQFKCCPVCRIARSLGGGNLGSSSSSGKCKGNICSHL
jgi:hypothetical protein